MPIIGSSASGAKSVPVAPTIGTATNVGSGRAYNNGAATVTFTAPTSKLPITSYTVTSSPGGYTGTGASSPITVAGLQSSTSYTFTVTATSAAGTSAASSASNSITATTVPQAPTIGSATAGNASATVAYTAGATGGAAVSTYTATSSPGSVTGTGASPITVSGLTNGTSYTFTVTATNANGTSAASSASGSVTPVSPYWIEVITGGINSPSNIAMNDTSVIYFSKGGSPQTVVLADNTGTITSQQQWTASGTSQVWSSWGVYDSANSRRIFTGYYRTASGQGLVPAIWAMSSSNTVAWGKYNDTTTSPGSSVSNAAAIGSSSYVAMHGYYQSNTYENSPLFMLFDSSGNNVYCQRFTGTTDGAGYTVAMENNTTNSYSGGITNTTGTYTGYVVKMNGGGGVDWSKKLSSSDYGVSASAAYSSSYNPVFAVTNSGNWTIFSLDKSNGAIVWQRTITGLTSTDTTTDMTMDSSGNVYFIARGIQSGQYGASLFKYNSSGTLQWQRRLYSPNNYSWDRITTDGTNLYLANSNFNGQLLYYPCNGSVTGTYTWQGYAYYIVAGTLTDSAGSLTVSAFSTGYITYGTGFNNMVSPTIATSSYTVRDRISI